MPPALFFLRIASALQSFVVSFGNVLLFRSNVRSKAERMEAIIFAFKYGF